MLTACSASAPPVKTVEFVDLEKFMGDWYVIANIPTFVEKGAHNAIESYQLDEDGTIATTFTFRKDSFDGKEKRYTPRGFVRDETGNALWGMQFVWPIKSDYRISWLSSDYSQVVIARNKRDYVWLMARTPQIPAEDYQRLVAHIESLGYDIDRLVKVPQQW